MGYNMEETTLDVLSLKGLSIIYSRFGFLQFSFCVVLMICIVSFVAYILTNFYVRSN